MQKQILAVIILFLFAFIAGCSGGSTNCNQTYGVYNPTPIPTPDPTPDPFITAVITGSVVNPLLDNEPINDAVITVSGDVKSVAKNVTAADGSFSIKLKVLPESVVTLSFTKDKYTIDDLAVNVGSDGTVTYDNTVCGYVLLHASGVKYITDTIVSGIADFCGATLSPDEKFLYAADELGCKIWRIDTSNGECIVIAGTGSSGGNDGSGDQATLTNPVGVAVSHGGDTLYVTEWSASKVRKITGLLTAQTSSDVTVYTIAGTGTQGYVDGAGDTARFSFLLGITICKDDDALYIGDCISAPRIRKITGVKDAISGANTVVSTIAGTGTAGAADGSGSTATFRRPYDFALTSNEDTLYVAENENNRLRKITGLKDAAAPAQVTVTTIAGGGLNEPIVGDPEIAGNTVRFNFLAGVALSNDENTLFTAEETGRKIKRTDKVKDAVNGTQTRVTAIASGQGFWGVRLNKRNTIMYATSRESNGSKAIFRIVASDN